MSNFIEYQDICAIHPGYYIADIIEDMEISQAEFAIRMQTTPKTISKLVNGQINLSNDLAKKLAVMLGTSVEVWLNLQKTYDQGILNISIAKDYDKQKNIAKLIDYSYFIKIANLPDTNDDNEKIKNLCKYLKVTNLNILEQPELLVNFSTNLSNISNENKINANAWVQTAMNFAKDIKVNKFSAKKLNSYLPEIRRMTLQSSKIFIPRLQEIFIECGVAFVLLPNLKNCGINGAVKWINKDKVLLAMNISNIDVGTFWFSIFHEIKHILQQKIKTIFINTDTVATVDFDVNLEKEADEFADNYLMPKEYFNKFLDSDTITKELINNIAKLIEIHPGVIVNSLQKNNLITYDQYNDLKECYYLD